ncbi:hypothetical protein ACIXGS_16235 [Bacteroides fragilis]|nr:hypothetical protein [Bacteroides fragilis]
MWNSINSLGSILLLGMSLFLANILIGPDASGELSIVQTLSGFMCGIIVLIYSVFLPRMTEKYANESYEHLAKEVRFSQKILSYFATTPTLLIILFGNSFFFFVDAWGKFGLFAMFICHFYDSFISARKYVDYLWAEYDIE